METGQELDQDVSTTRMQFAERQTTDVTPDVERIADSFTYVTLAQWRGKVCNSLKQQTNVDNGKGKSNVDFYIAFLL